MKYLGSKNRISKYIVPIIQSYITKDTKGYIEPFVGGANVIDKIDCDNKIGRDIHPQLIALLSHVAETTEDIPLEITEEEYNKVKNNKELYDDWYVGLVGFCATYSARYFEGYARSKKKDGTPRNMSNEAIRNLLKQSPNLKDIKFECGDFREVNNISGYVIYCDPPYKGAKGYSGTNKFPYEEFYDWCREMGKNNIVIISEYSMPCDFKYIWEKEYITNLDSKREKANKKVEKLFIYDNN